MDCIDCVNFLPKKVFNWVLLLQSNCTTILLTQAVISGKNGSSRPAYPKTSLWWWGVAFSQIYWIRRAFSFTANTGSVIGLLIKRYLWYGPHHTMRGCMWMTRICPLIPAAHACLVTVALSCLFLSTRSMQRWSCTSSLSFGAVFSTAVRLCDCNRSRTCHGRFGWSFSHKLTSMFVGPAWCYNPRRVLCLKQISGVLIDLMTSAPVMKMKGGETVIVNVGNDFHHHLPPRRLPFHRSLYREIYHVRQSSIWKLAPVVFSILTERMSQGKMNRDKMYVGSCIKNRNYQGGLVIGPKH